MRVLVIKQAYCPWRANRTDFTETHRISQKEKKNQKKKKRYLPLLILLEIKKKRCYLCPRTPVTYVSNPYRGDIGGLITEKK